MHGFHEPSLVVVSIGIAILASYTALDLAGRVASSRSRVWLVWLAAGSLAMGMGIWSMHFVAMLSFQLPVPIGYDIPQLVLSAVVAVGASALALWVVGHAHVPLLPLVGAALCMGAAIAGMHYIGMAAMRMRALLGYDPLRVGLSVTVAVVASFAALWLALHLRHADSPRGRWVKLGSATIMGLAISGMHYTAMAAARFQPQGEPLGAGEARLEITERHLIATDGLAGAVVVTTLVILGLTLVGVMADRWLRLRAAEAAVRERLLHELERKAAELQDAHVEMAIANAQLQQTNAQLRLKTAEAESARAEAEEANRAKSQFLATMSHELRTPLNAIGGFAELLEMELRGPLTEAQRADLGKIQRAQKQLLRVINDVLSFAKLEAGQINFEFEDIPLDKLLRVVESLVEPQIVAKRIGYAYRAGDPGVRVRADRERLEQVILNLLSNAIKFTPPGGRIALSWEADPRETRIQVSDTGIGIPPDKLEAVFEPFVQVDAGLTRSSEGTGLGLAISRDLARAMHGDLRVSSELGTGTAFTLTLPGAVPQAAPEREHPAAASALRA